MGAVFAIQVRTGLETRAKEMLKHVFLQANEKLVKRIFSLETHTEFISSGSIGVDTEARVNEEDISVHLIRERYRSAITNLRLQMEAIERYNTPEYKSKKALYQKEIRQLENEMNCIGKSSKTIHSVLTGYLLIELNSHYLPNHIWHLIKSVPLVNKILSRDPIPQEEMNAFISNMEELLIPEIEIDFGREVVEEEIMQLQSKILDEVNKKDTPIEKQVQLLDRIDDLKLSVVEKTKELLNDKTGNPFFNKIKAFVKRKTQKVSMPLHFLEKLYTNEELRYIGRFIQNKDFLYRLRTIIDRKVVIE